MIFKEVKHTDYGYVSRGQNRYSVPALPDAGIPSLVSGNRCPVECCTSSSSNLSEENFCEKNKLLCIAGIIAVLILIAK